jgi:hypothetical protein
MMMRRVQTAVAFSDGGDSTFASTVASEASETMPFSCNGSAIVASGVRFEVRWLLRFEVAAELGVQGSKQRSCHVKLTRVIAAAIIIWARTRNNTLLAMRCSASIRCSNIDVHDAYLNITG